MAIDYLYPEHVATVDLCRTAPTVLRCGVRAHAK